MDFKCSTCKTLYATLELLVKHDPMNCKGKDENKVSAKISAGKNKKKVTKKKKNKSKN